MDNEAPSSALIYRGAICDQTVRSNQRDELQVVLTVAIDAEMAVDSDGNESPRDIDPCERDVYLTFCEDASRLRIAMQALASLGFDSGEIARLHPDSPQFWSLLNREVFVVPRVVGERTYWNLWWPRQASKPLSLREAQDKQRALGNTIGAIQQEFRGGPPPGDERRSSNVAAHAVQKKGVNRDR